MRGATRAEPFVPRSGFGPGVLVLALGAKSGELARDAGERLAHHGFVASAPELPAPSDDTPSEAERGAVDAAIEQLFCEQAVHGPRVGVLGFGRGGRLAIDAAARGARVAVVVALDADLDPRTFDGSLARLDAFVLAVFAGKGAGAARGDPAELERRLRAEQIANDVRTQPGAGEGYADPGRPDCYDASAARASWDAALARLRSEL
ncbi:MAG TPA: dienelactone hydrolase family protein [Myxococcota bacterium]|nr:dienelactone hydrolase family protein [Myxococcota bacterium]